MMKGKWGVVLGVVALCSVGSAAHGANTLRLGVLFSTWNISENKFFPEHDLVGFGICGDLGSPDAPMALEFRAKVLSSAEAEVTVVPIEVGIIGRLKITDYFRPTGSVGILGRRVSSSSDQNTALGLYARAGLELGLGSFWLFADYQIAGSGYARTSRNASGIVQRESTQYQGTGLNLGVKYEF